MREKAIRYRIKETTGTISYLLKGEGESTGQPNVVHWTASLASSPPLRDMLALLVWESGLLGTALIHSAFLRHRNHRGGKDGNFSSFPPRPVVCTLSIQRINESHGGRSSTLLKSTSYHELDVKYQDGET